MTLAKLTLDSQFNFSCHSGLGCYTKCCADINILLTPYDILRMKNRLNLDSEEFLERYTIFHMGEDVCFPTVQLKMEDNEVKSCPFVSEEGCLIYEDRPWSCRIYPLGMASSKEEAEEFYFFVREPHCLGFNQGKEWTVDQWEKDQGIKVYNQMNELFKEITLNPILQIPTKLSVDKLEMAFMSCYNLDKFRRFILESKFLTLFEINQGWLKKIMEDEVELMIFGFNWLKFALFGEDTIKVKDKVLKQAKERAA